jgi:SAM-dependent methyltransferase
MFNSSFDQVAEKYDYVRPGYPFKLFEDLIKKSHIKKRGLILEIGCGTGQATLPLARRGYRMHCVEPGARLLELAKKKCSSYNIQFFNELFEDWKPPKTRYDLVISATAFHWVNPKIGYPKIASVLKQDRYIGLFWNFHPTPFSGFFEEAQNVYKKVVPEWTDPSNRPSVEKRIQNIVADLEKTLLFEDVSVTTYGWVRTYTAEEYILLLDTYSDHIKLEETRRKDLYNSLYNIIIDNYSGLVKRPYLTALFMAKSSNHKGFKRNFAKAERS